VRSVAVRLENGPVFDLSAIASEIYDLLNEKNKEVEFVGSSANFLALSALLFHEDAEKAFEEAAKVLWEDDLLAEVEQEEVINDLNELFEKLNISAKAIKGSIKVEGEVEELLREIREYLITRMKSLYQNVRGAQDALILASYLAFNYEGSEVRVIDIKE